MYWQRMFKLLYPFLASGKSRNPDKGKTALYDNTSPTWEIFLPEISVKIANVMCCLNLLFLQLTNYSKWEKKITELV